MTHYLKTTPSNYLDILISHKRFVLLENDEHYKVGDWLCLQAHNGKEYLGGEVMRKVKYILSDCEKYGLMDGFVILGL